MDGHICAGITGADVSTQVRHAVMPSLIFGCVREHLSLSRSLSLSHTHTHTHTHTHSLTHSCALVFTCRLAAAAQLKPAGADLDVPSACPDPFSLSVHALVSLSASLPATVTSVRLRYACQGRALLCLDLIFFLACLPPGGRK